MDDSQDEREGPQDGSASPVNAEGSKEITDTGTGDGNEGQGSALNPERPPLDESALIVYSFDEVCELLKANALTLKRLIIYHRIPVELHDLDFGHVQYGTLDEWPDTEASHTIMITKSNVEKLKSLLLAYGEEPNVVIPVASPTAQNHGGTIPSSVESRRTRGLDKSYDEAKKICMPLLRDDFRREKPFRSARQLHERVEKKLKGDAPSERSISRWMREWREEIKKGI